MFIKLFLTLLFLTIVQFIVILIAKRNILLKISNLNPSEHFEEIIKEKD